jgi:hypothetical protein
LRPANEPAESPKMVTLFGSPPNAAIFCFTHLSAASWSYGQNPTFAKFEGRLTLEGGGDAPIAPPAHAS